jgi:protein SCO1/2
MCRAGTVKEMRLPCGLWISLALIALTGLSACRSTAEPEKRYPLRGQILTVGSNAVSGQREVSVNHEDIPGFMPAMTMAYVVKTPALLDGVSPGDLFTATLVLKGGEMYLEEIKKTGRQPLPPDAKPVKAMDVMQPGDEVPDDPLQDQAGETRRLSAWRGRALAVTFVYTRCPVPDFCPLMDRRFAEVQRAIVADPVLRDRAHLVSVSFDPARDTVDVIRAHAKARGADPRIWSYLTGSQAAVDRFTSRFGVSTIAETDGARTISHNLRTAIVGPDGRLIKIYSGSEWTVEGLLADLRNAR